MTTGKLRTGRAGSGPLSLSFSLSQSSARLHLLPNAVNQMDSILTAALREEAAESEDARDPKVERKLSLLLLFLSNAVLSVTKH